MPIAENWHLDKKIPIGLMFGLLVQGAGFVWWASSIESRVATQIAQTDRQAAQIEALRMETQALNVGAASVAAKLEALSASLDEVKEAQKETNNLLRGLASKGQ